SLSYHAGIQADLDASWVGLGWTLNPGAIARYVNGFADDHDDVSTSSRQFWEGGVTETFSTGISVGIGKAASVSANVVTANDSYRGTGVGFMLGAGLGLKGTPIGVNAGIGFQPYGQFAVSAGLSAGIGRTSNKALSLGVGVNFSYNQGSGVSVGAGAGVSATASQGDKGASRSLLGASISSNLKNGGSSVGVSFAGASSSQNNSRAGNVSTQSGSFGLSVMVLPGLSITHSRNYVRYWIDETESVTTYGSLHNLQGQDWDFVDTDVFAISDYEETPNYSNDEVADKNITKTKKDNLGIFLDYDVYQVNAQGIGGNIRPYNYKAYVNDRNVFQTENDGQRSYDSKNYNHNEALDQVLPGFRFVDDFSNKFIQGNHAYNSNGETPLDIRLSDNFESFSENPFTLSEDQLTELIDNPGSRQIEYLTNEKMLGDHSFMETQSTGFTRAADDQIGAFRITNESGVTYHFSLPAYSSNEEVYSENIDHRKRWENGGPAGGLSFNHYRKPERYAYTWHLTAITGPDYVDRDASGNANGVLDEHDWGYWVEFDHGKWASHFRWRNPGIGFHQDLDNNFQNFSTGQKEIYYLDAIRTKTHTALFVKDLREDGKGATQVGSVVGLTDNGVDRNEGGFF
ncbi:MAG: hypothetical protein AAGA85_28590, partial [Bacteroidota bacterium]